MGNAVKVRLIVILGSILWGLASSGWLLLLEGVVRDVLPLGSSTGVQRISCKKELNQKVQSRWR